nr:PRC-barrel domain-containing protein [uncultured Acidocella sp.]
MSYTNQNRPVTDGALETMSLIAASKVNFTNVYGVDGEKIGSIYDVMIDKMSGRVAYAVLSFGGFLGIGEKYHPLPWNQLKYSEQHGGYIINLSRDVLEGAPAYAEADMPDWSQPGYRGQIDDYYGRHRPLV